ncbi:tripartite tricarboxylate transporter permease [Oscillospiraceae bacterium LTW-04]|nr:tripartite tricarboxylate transporter permease [Oscillospiraceae bacterium MB24-C1]
MVLQGLINVSSPVTLLLIIVGTTWGLTAGALPGLSASMAVILMLPFTYGMGAIQSVVVLVAVYVGAMCGGSISAILLKTPGTPSSVATTFDGYPMAMRGDAPRAIGLSITASSVGGICSGLVMVTCAPLLAQWALKFQSAEFFALSLLGLSCIASIGSDQPVKALLSACLGLLISTVGLDSISGAQRYTFNQQFLMNGIDYIPVMIGAYALAEVYRNILLNKKTQANTTSEAANNAAVGGSLVPTLVLGIPGGTVAAILLAAFTMHGLIPGPLLLRNQPDMLYSILFGMIVSSLLLFVVGIFVARQFSRIVTLPYPFLATIIMILGLLGSYSLRNSIYDVMIMFGFSFLGFMFDKYGYSTSSFILGIVLGAIAENGLRKQMIVSGGSWTGFFTRPISLIVLIISVISFLTPLIRAKRKVKSN